MSRSKKNSRTSKKKTGWPKYSRSKYGSKGSKSYKLVRLRPSSPRSSPSPSASLTIQYKADGPWSFKKSTFLSGWKWDYSDSGYGPSAMRYPQEVGYTGPHKSLPLFKEKVVRELERFKRDGVIKAYKVKTGRVSE